MSDSYKQDIERIQRQITTTRGDLQKREQRKLIGQPTGMIDGDIRGGLTQLDRELEMLKLLIEKQSTQKAVLPKEAESRKNKHMEFVNAVQDLKQAFELQLNSNREGLFNNKNPNGVQYKDTEAIKGMNQKDLLQNQKQLQQEQDEKLDHVIDNLGDLKNKGQQIGQTISDQNKLLDKVNKDVDKTNEGLIKTNSKLKKFIANSSNCCLWIIIALEVASLVTLILVLP